MKNGPPILRLNKLLNRFPYLVVINTSEDLAAPALVHVVLLHLVLLQRLAAGVASEEHHPEVEVKQIHRGQTKGQMVAFFHVLLLDPFSRVEVWKVTESVFILKGKLSCPLIRQLRTSTNQIATFLQEQNLQTNMSLA